MTAGWPWSARSGWREAWAMARRMIRRPRRDRTARDAALWFARHASRRRLPAWAILLAARLALTPAPWAAIGRRAELERLFGRRATIVTAATSCPDLVAACHYDPLARVYLRRASRAWQRRKEKGDG